MPRGIVTVVAALALATGCGTAAKSPQDGAATGTDGGAEPLPFDGRAPAGDAPTTTSDGQADAPGLDAAVERPEGLAADAPDRDALGVGSDVPVDGPAPDAPTDLGEPDAREAGIDAGIEARPFVMRDCTKQDCTCASTDSCSFNCPGGDCTVDCLSGSTCTVTCSAPFACKIRCAQDAQCTLACNLGLCWHSGGPAKELACDPNGTGCL